MNRAIHPCCIRIVVSSMCLFAALGSASAQDSFGGVSGRQQVQPQQQNYPEQQGYPQQGGSEAQDFGVAPTQQLRPTEQLHGPTPTTIPGGRVIGTQQLAQLLQGGQGKVLLLDVYGGPQHIPGAVSGGPAGMGGSFDDQVQQGFGQYLQQATQGDVSRPLVFYCGGVQCWSSYNAALRAVKLGYRNVGWYRGGIEAWQQTGLPLQGAGGQQGPRQGQQPPSTPPSAGSQW